MAKRKSTFHKTTMKPIKYPNHKNQGPLFKVNPNNPIELLAALIVGVPLLIIGFAIKYPAFGYILVVAIITVVFFVIRSKRKKRAQYLKWFYDRTRRIQELNANDCIDLELTNAIINAANSGKAVGIGTDSKYFQDYRDAYNEMFSSQDIRHNGCRLGNSDSDSVSGSYGIVAKSKPLVFRYYGENNGGYCFYIFNETVLAFIEGPEKKVFLAAYKPNLIKYNLHWGSLTEERIINDKTQNRIQYYYKYNPVPEARLESAYWKVQNKDGSRSFRGGLLPEHNPLIFKLKYGAVELIVGDFSNVTYFSNVKAFNDFAEAQGDYYRHLPRNFSRQVIEEPITSQREEDVFSKTTATQEDKVVRETQNTAPVEEKRPKDTQSKDDSVFSRTDIPAARPNTVESSPVTVTPSNDAPKQEVTKQETPKEESKVENSVSNSLDESTIRTRNRDIVNNAVTTLNKAFERLGRYSFKTYQVRKPRQGWGLQDAGVYTYTKDGNGNEYTIEFDLHTDLNVPKTDLKFSVWGKTKEKVAERYNFTVTKAKMKPDGEGFSLTLPRDYESMTKAAITAQFEKDVLTLMKLIEVDANR